MEGRVVMDWVSEYAAFDLTVKKETALKTPEGAESILGQNNAKSQK